MIDLDKNRYLPPRILNKVIHQKEWTNLVQTEGYSSQNKPIVSFNIGSGPLKFWGGRRCMGMKRPLQKPYLT